MNIISFFVGYFFIMLVLIFRTQLVKRKEDKVVEEVKKVLKEKKDNQTRTKDDKKMALLKQKMNEISEAGTDGIESMKPKEKKIKNEINILTDLLEE